MRDNDYNDACTYSWCDSTDQRKDVGHQTGILASSSTLQSEPAYSNAMPSSLGNYCVFDSKHFSRQCSLIEATEPRQQQGLSVRALSLTNTDSGDREMDDSEVLTGDQVSSLPAGVLECLLGDFDSDENTLRDGSPPQELSNTQNTTCNTSVQHRQYTFVFENPGISSNESLFRHPRSVPRDDDKRSPGKVSGVKRIISQSTREERFVDVHAYRAIALSITRRRSEEVLPKEWKDKAAGKQKAKPGRRKSAPW